MNFYRVHVFLGDSSDNIEKIVNLVRSDRRLNICAIAKTVGIDKEFVLQIFQFWHAKIVY